MAIVPRGLQDDARPFDVHLEHRAGVAVGARASELSSGRTPSARRRCDTLSCG
jgi:hypothetical protein